MTDPTTVSSGALPVILVVDDDPVTRPQLVETVLEYLIRELDAATTSTSG